MIATATARSVVGQFGLKFCNISRNSEDEVSQLPTSMSLTKLIDNVENDHYTHPYPYGFSEIDPYSTPSAGDANDHDERNKVSIPRYTHGTRPR